MKIDPIRAGLALFVIVIVYLTLYPFSLSAIPREGLSWSVPSSRGEWMDALLNCYFFLPFGFFGGLLVPGWRGVLWTGLGGALLSFTVESIQLYIPMRDGSYRDILLNTIGALSGAGLAQLAIVKRLRLHRVADGWSPHLQALLLAGIWVVAEWSPLVPSLRVSNIPRVFFDGGPWVPIVAVAFAGFAISRLLPLLVSRQALPWLRLLVLVAIPMQFFLMARSVRAIEVAGTLLGVVAGFWVPAAGSGAMAIAALAVLALRQFTPFQWEPTAVNSFGWMPLAGAFRIPPDQGFRIMIEKLFFVTYPIWAVRRGFGTSWWSAVLGVTALVGVGEIGQLYQPGRVPEIADFLICGLGGLMLVLTDDRAVIE